MQNWAEFIFSTNVSFEEKALRVFEYQLANNEVYQRYCKALGIENPTLVEEIPLLPIKAFKETKIVSAPKDSILTTQDSLLFQSSGTSSMQRSIHKVLEAAIYDQSILKGFQQFYNLSNSVIWGYTSGYNENPHSSLIYMIQKLVRQDETGLSRFLPLDEPLNANKIDQVKKSGKQLIVFGAAFGLFNLVQMKAVSLPSSSIIIETGGMKTYRREMARDELHRTLAKGFGLDVSRIHSEYGMCELLSQAYATGGKWFRTVPWLEASIRKPENPFEKRQPYKEGLIGIIDLANIHSCSFLLTGDRGMMDSKGRFQVMGRWNPKDLRGCNFLIEED